MTAPLHREPSAVSQARMVVDDKDVLTALKAVRTALHADDVAEPDDAEQEVEAAAEARQATVANTAQAAALSVLAGAAKQASDFDFKASDVRSDSPFDDAEDDPFAPASHPQGARAEVRSYRQTLDRDQAGRGGDVFDAAY